MTPSKYVELAVKTESRDFVNIADRLSWRVNIRLLHGALGLCTESGEIQDDVKRAMFYGKELDVNHLVEELGDLLWYVAIISDTIDFSIEEIMERNIAKLKARYGEKFSSERAMNRDLDNEKLAMSTPK